MDVLRSSSRRRPGVSLFQTGSAYFRLLLVIISAARSPVCSQNPIRTASSFSVKVRVAVDLSLEVALATRRLLFVKHGLITECFQTDVNVLGPCRPWHWPSRLDPEWSKYSPQALRASAMMNNRMKDGKWGAPVGVRNRAREPTVAATKRVPGCRKPHTASASAAASAAL